MIKNFMTPTSKSKLCRKLFWIWSGEEQLIKLSHNSTKRAAHASHYDDDNFISDSYLEAEPDKGIQDDPEKDIRD